MLPTKSYNINARSKQFNKVLFDYLDAQMDPLLQALNFNVFADTNTHLLKKEFGRYNNNFDLIHLGSSGVKLLVNLIKERVCGSRVDGRLYGDVSSENRGRVHNRGRVQNEMRRFDSRRVGNVSMMNTTTTSNGTLLVPSQQMQP